MNDTLITRQLMLACGGAGDGTWMVPGLLIRLRNIVLRAATIYIALLCSMVDLPLFHPVREPLFVGGVGAVQAKVYTCPARPWPAGRPTQILYICTGLLVPLRPCARRESYSPL